MVEKRSSKPRGRASSGPTKRIMNYESCFYNIYSFWFKVCYRCVSQPCVSAPYLFLLYLTSTPFLSLFVINQMKDLWAALAAARRLRGKHVGTETYNRKVIQGITTSGWFHHKQMMNMSCTYSQGVTDAASSLVTPCTCDFNETTSTCTPFNLCIFLYDFHATLNMIDVILLVTNIVRPYSPAKHIYIYIC